MARQSNNRRVSEPESFRPCEPIALRFVKNEDYAELINLYHLAKAALCGPGKGVISKYDRMIYACNEWAKVHTYCSATGAYKDLSARLEGY